MNWCWTRDRFMCDIVLWRRPVGNFSNFWWRTVCDGCWGEVYISKQVAIIGENPGAFKPRNNIVGCHCRILCLFYNSGISYIVTVLPGLLLSHASVAMLYAVLNGPYTHLSSGCKRCDVCGGMVNITTPRALASSIACKDMCSS